MGFAIRRLEGGKRAPDLHVYLPGPARVYHILCGAFLFRIIINNINVKPFQHIILIFGLVETLIN